MVKGYFLSAYATSPSCGEVIESIYFKNIASRSEIRGIEHPYFFDSEKYSINWLLANIPDHWELIITALPAFMEALKINPNIGLASINESDRCNAVLLIEKVNRYANKLNQVFGRNVIKALHLHSAPKNSYNSIRGSKLSLKKSLDEIISMDWGDITLNIEHCDAYIHNYEPIKGFLSLEDEIEAIHSVGHYGLVLNWGRSAIETRSINGPLKHLQKVIESKLLRGFVFSGCTDNPTSVYKAWADTHMPPANFINGNYLPHDSILGYKEIKQAFDILEHENIYLGIKVSNPHNLKNIKDSVGVVFESIDAIEMVKKEK